MAESELTDSTWRRVLLAAGVTVGLILSTGHRYRFRQRIRRAGTPGPDGAAG